MNRNYAARGLPIPKHGAVDPLPKHVCCTEGHQFYPKAHSGASLRHNLLPSVEISYPEHLNPFGTPRSTPFQPSSPKTENCSVVMGQWKGRGYVHMPYPTAIHDFRSDLDEPPDQPFDRSPDFFTQEIEPPDQMQKVVRQNPHLQPRLSGLLTIGPQTDDNWSCPSARCSCPP